MIQGGGIAVALAKGKADLNIIQIGQMYGTDNEPNPQAGRVYSADGVCPTLDSMGGW